MSGKNIELMSPNISVSAGYDLEEIWLYTANAWSIEQADKYLNLIFKEIEFLCKNPKSGTNFSHIKEGYYRSKIKSHFIFYKINLQSKTLDVIRILHQMMDVTSHLTK